LSYKNSVPLCAFFADSVVKFYHRVHKGENAKFTEVSIVWFYNNGFYL